MGLLCIGFILKAQFTTLWEKSAGSSYTWFSTSSSNTTGCAYNPVTNKLLVADRSNLICIVNVATGASEGTLNTTGVGSESYKWNKIRVTADGVIYGISMVTTASSSCKIYRWENQAAAPTLCATFAVTERCGDAFGLSGTGTNTILYASGNGITSSAVNIYVLTTANGTDFSLSNTINIPITGTNAWAGRSVDPITTGTSSDLWIRSQNTNTRRINSTGIVQFTSTDGSGANQVPSNFSNARYFEGTDGSKYLAMLGTSAQATGGLRLKVLNVTNESSITDVGTDSLSNTFNANLSGIGDAAIKNNGDGTFTIFYLLTNNGLKAVQTQSLTPVTFSKFYGELKQNSIQLNWTTSTENNNTGFSLERSSNGIDFSPIAFINSKAQNGNASTSINYTYTDNSILQGKSFYRLKQIDKDRKYTFSSILDFNTSKGLFSASLLNNPIKDKIGIKISCNNNEIVTIKMYSVDGKILATKQENLSSGTNLVEYELPTNLKTSFLIVQITSQFNKKSINLKAIIN